MLLTPLLRRLFLPRPGPTGAAVLAVAIVLTVRGLSPAEPVPDPVARLQDALQGKGNLKAAADNVQSLGDVSRALLLKDWHGTAAEEQLRDQMAKRFQDGFRAVVKSGSPDEQQAAARLLGEMAVAARTLILGYEQAFFREKFAEITPSLIQLTGASHPLAVRRAAIDSLGQMESARGYSEKAARLTDEAALREEEDKKAELKKAAAAAEQSAIEAKKALPAAYQKLLALDNPVEVRVAAAESLGTLVQISAKELTGVAPGTALSAVRESSRLPSRINLVQRARMVLPLASEGLDKRQPVAVRRASIEDFRLLTTVLADPATDLSATESPLLIGLDDQKREAERQRLEGLQKTLSSDLRGLSQDFQRSAPALAAAALDPDPEVRVTARKVLENLAYVRRRFLERVPESVPPPKPKPETERSVRLPATASPFQVVARSRPTRQEGPAAAGASADQLRDALRQTLPALREGLADPDPKARLAAVAVLDAMGKDAESGIPALVERLQDPDRFVRWAAARALGKLAPLQPKLVVPPLGDVAANALGDLGPRLAAIQALENYGPEAQAAVPRLREVVRRGFAPQGSPWPVAYANQPANRDAFRGNADLRVAAMRALRAVGTKAASAIPDFGQTLATDADPAVRRVAAEVLGAFGKEASSQASILRDRLGDPDPEVRRNASEALLKVLGK